MDIVALLRENNLLREIYEELDTHLEIPHVAYIEAKKKNSKALLFKNPIRGAKKFKIPVLMNIFCSNEALEIFFKQDLDSIASRIADILSPNIKRGFLNKLSLIPKLLNIKRSIPKKIKREGICQHHIYKADDINLYNLPILKTWSKDGGEFITMGQVYTQSLKGDVKNLGMYRLQVYDKNHLGMHWQIHKDASSFFDEYKRNNKKMPVSIAIGGSPLYSWLATAPFPKGFYELLAYGFISNRQVKVVKSITNPILIPQDVDFVIEGWVYPDKMKIEGPFGDHTGYYTPKEEYPYMNVSCITHKRDPIYYSSVVGKPPLEDKYMGYATERIFLPMMKILSPDVIDYAMPENGVFHNLILVKADTRYFGHAKQIMHSFWGNGQMSSVKHAIFVGKDAPSLRDYEAITRYILDRFDNSTLLITEGICDVLDHSSPTYAYGGKLGLDLTKPNLKYSKKSSIKDSELLKKLKLIDSCIINLKQYFIDTKTPITVISVDKKESMEKLFVKLEKLKEFSKVVLFVDEKRNDITNPYMLVWRTVNNIDAKRDIYITKELIGIDATNKSKIDNYYRDWPEDIECDDKIISSLQKRGIIDIDANFKKRFYI